MIHFYRTVTLMPGKTAPAMAWAHEVNAYLKQHHGIDIHLAAPVSGNPMRIGWVVRYASLAGVDEELAKMAGDARYWELVSKGAECVLPGSVDDEIWRTL